MAKLSNYHFFVTDAEDKYAEVFDLDKGKASKASNLLYKMNT